MTQAEFDSVIDAAWQVACGGCLTPDCHICDDVVKRINALTPSDCGISIAGDGWQLIETAPNGRKVLAGYLNSLGNWRTVTARYFAAETLECETSESGWADEGWYEESETHEILLMMECEPTHWRGLPAPPSIAPDKGSS